jgi:hypothetical protein
VNHIAKDLPEFPATLRLHPYFFDSVTLKIHARESLPAWLSDAHSERWLIVGGAFGRGGPYSRFSPASNSACDDGQNGPTDGGYYQLAYDGAIVNAPQGWDQGLED